MYYNRKPHPELPNLEPVSGMSPERQFREADAGLWRVEQDAHRESLMWNPDLWPEFRISPEEYHRRYMIYVEKIRRERGLPLWNA